MVKNSASKNMSTPEGKRSSARRDSKSLPRNSLGSTAAPKDNSKGKDRSLRRRSEPPVPKQSSKKKEKEKSVKPKKVPVPTEVKQATAVEAVIKEEHQDLTLAQIALLKVSSKRSSRRSSAASNSGESNVEPGVICKTKLLVGKIPFAETAQEMENKTEEKEIKTPCKEVPAEKPLPPSKESPNKSSATKSSNQDAESSAPREIKSKIEGLKDLLPLMEKAMAAAIPPLSEQGPVAKGEIAPVSEKNKVPQAGNDKDSKKLSEPSKDVKKKKKTDRKEKKRDHKDKKKDGKLNGGSVNKKVKPSNVTKAPKTSKAPAAEVVLTAATNFNSEVIVELKDQDQPKSSKAKKAEPGNESKKNQSKVEDETLHNSADSSKKSNGVVAEKNTSTPQKSIEPEPCNESTPKRYSDVESESEIVSPETIREMVEEVTICKGSPDQEATLTESAEAELVIPKVQDDDAKPARKKKSRKDSDLMKDEALKVTAPLFNKEGISPRRQRKLPSRYLSYEEVGLAGLRPGSEEVKVKVEKNEEPVEIMEPKKKRGSKKVPKPEIKKEEVSAKTHSVSSVVSELKKKLAPLVSKIVSPPKEVVPTVPPPVLNKTQAEYAVSALYIAQDPPQQEEEVKPPNTTVAPVKKRNYSKRKRFNKLLKNLKTQKWSQEKLLKRKIRKRKYAGTLAERELKRLGHVIIDMEKSEEPVEVSEEDEDCSMEFCKMGCVCRSLEVPMRQEFHCGKVECIFKCLCSHAGASNCFYDSRVMDKTRNLAPEEKDFINTVISKGSQKSMVVAERGKRERKLPQKLQGDFITGEHLDLDGVGRRKLVLRDEDGTPKKRRLLENFDLNSCYSPADRNSIVPSPDFLENRFSRHVESLVDEDDEEGLLRIETREAEEDTPKIISIASIAPEEFEKADKITGEVKQDLEIVSEVAVTSPSSFQMMELRSQAKLRAMQLLPQFKESIIHADVFKPEVMTFNKFCIVDWTSFTQRFRKKGLYIWVENSHNSTHSIAVITNSITKPYINYVDINVMSCFGLNQAKTFDNLNLNEGSLRCPFILWCNGTYWEILGKLSNSQHSQRTNRLYPVPVPGLSLPDEPQGMKWFEIPATMQNTYSMLMVRRENLSINYPTICKLLTISWRTKKAFVSKIKKHSGPHLHRNPFGLYSIPSKAKIFFGPYAIDEMISVVLIPKNKQEKPFKVPFFITRNERRHSGISSLKEHGMQAAAESQTEAREAKRFKPSSPSTSLPIVLPGEVKLGNEQDLLPSMKKSFNQRSSEPHDDSDASQIEESDPGYFSCVNGQFKDVPYLLYKNGNCKLKNPMGSKLLHFESVYWATKFLTYIFQDIHSVNLLWNRNRGMPPTVGLQEYEYIRIAEASRISSGEMIMLINTQGGMQLQENSPLAAALKSCAMYKEKVMHLKTQKTAQAKKFELDVRHMKVDLPPTPFNTLFPNVIFAPEKNSSRMVIEEGASNAVEVPMALNDEGAEIRDQYREELRMAFEEVETLYPAFMDGKTSRLMLLQRMNNEIELLQLQEKALEAAMEETKKEKDAIFKLFRGLEKDERKKILLALQENEEEEESLKSKNKKETAHKPLNLPAKKPTLARPRVVVKGTVLKKRPVEAAKAQETCSKVLAVPDAGHSSAEASKHPIAPKSTQMIISKLNPVKSAQKSGGLIPLSMYLPKTMTAGGAKIHISKINSSLSQPVKRSSSVPWVKCIPSISPFSNTEEKTKSNRPAKPQVEKEEDDLSGMPVLTHCGSQGPLTEPIVQPVKSKEELKEAGFAGLNSSELLAAATRKIQPTGTLVSRSLISLSGSKLIIIDGQATVMDNNVDKIKEEKDTDPANAADNV